jgi:hypothetical protein
LTLPEALALPVVLTFVKALTLPKTLKSSIHLQIWLPDITAFNALGTPSTNYVTWEETTNVVVMSNGYIVFVPPQTFKVCKVK